MVPLVLPFENNKFVFPRLERRLADVGMEPELPAFAALLRRASRDLLGKLLPTNVTFESGHSIEQELVFVGCPLAFAAFVGFWLTLHATEELQERGVGTEQALVAKRKLCDWREGGGSRSH